MEIPLHVSTVDSSRRTPAKTRIMTGTTAASTLQTSSVMNVLPSTSFIDQSSNLITEVLPSGGFTLVSLDLNPLHLDPTSQQQVEDARTEEADDLNDGVNLVVKGSWWWCKDCNMKQKFGAGESIEDHLRRKHSINDKTEKTVDQELLKNSHSNPCRQAPVKVKEGASSDVISSVFTIPSDSVSVQDQDVETFIVIDGTTTVQVITKQTDDNTVLLTPLTEESKPALTPQHSSEASPSSGPSNPASADAGPAVKPLVQMDPVPVKPLVQMDPIPVLFALALTDTQPPSSHPTPTSSQTERWDKQPGCSGAKVTEICSSSVMSPQPCWEGGRANCILTKPARDGESGRNETQSGVSLAVDRNKGQTNISLDTATNKPQADFDFDTSRNKTQTDVNFDTARNNAQTDVNFDTARNNAQTDVNFDTARNNTQTDVNFDTARNKTQTNASSDGAKRNHPPGDVRQLAGEGARGKMMPAKPAQSNTPSCSIMTRKKFRLKREENAGRTLLKDCKVRLTRLSSDELDQLHHKPRRSFFKRKSEVALVATLPVKHAKQTKTAKKAVSLICNPLKNSAKNNACRAHGGQCRNNTKREIFSANSQSAVHTGKHHTSFSIKTRTFCGRKIRKPARYLTGSENEEEEQEEEQKPDQQLLMSLPAARSRGNSSHLRENRQRNSGRCPKKRRSSPDTDHSEPEVPNAGASPKNSSKKPRDETYSCQDCGRKFRWEKKLEKHRKLYAGHTMQRCSQCGLALHNQHLLNVHRYHVHSTKESTSCLTCGRVLGSKRNLLNHLLTHPNMEGQTVANLIRDSCAVHDCSVCDEPIIIGEGRVERHYLMHEKPNMCVCQKCGQSFRHKKELYSHLRTHGNLTDIGQQCSAAEDRKEGCTIGNISASPEPVTFSENTDQNVAQNTDERVIADSVKQIMKFEESSSQILENEMSLTLSASKTEETKVKGQQKLQNTKPLICCELCKKQFSAKKLLYQHLKSHGSEVSDLADNEDSALGREREPVAQPIDLKAGVPFGIPCGLVKLESQEKDDNFLRKSFTTTAQGLVVPSQMRYSCALCERQFESESKARRHIARFSGQQNILQCNLCSGKFHNMDLFNVHYVYIHQSAGAATCLTCKTDFNNKGDFITHLGNSPLAHPQSHKMGFALFIQDACGRITCTVCQKSMWNYPMNVANHSRKHRNLRCPICQQEMPHKYALFIHLQIHSYSRSLSLDSKLSEKERQQNEQMEKLHRIVSEVESSSFVESNGKFFCSFCEGEVLCTRRNIHQHLDLHARKLLHSIREGRYFCPDCGEDLAVSDQTIIHHLSAHGHSQVAFTCIFCSQTFSSFEEFKGHESKKHWLNLYFEKNMCEVCGKEFVSRQQFQKHVKLHEEKQGLFSCSHCKQTFRFESKLQKHMVKHNKASYACQYCGKLYMTKISLHRHEQVVHIGIKDFKHKCKLCDAQFINATHLRDHVTNKHTSGASYRCAQCGMGFQYLSTFARHKRVVHGGDTPYVCQECGEKFPQKKHLQRHSITHTGINPFQCPACPKSFSLERTLKEHFDFCHQGIQRFVCPYCGSKFPRNRSLKRHLETCRMSGLQAESGPVYSKVPLEVHGGAAQPPAGLVVIQQV